MIQARKIAALTVAIALLAVGRTAAGGAPTQPRRELACRTRISAILPSTVDRPPISASGACFRSTDLQAALRSKSLRRDMDSLLQELESFRWLLTRIGPREKSCEAQTLRRARVLLFAFRLKGHQRVKIFARRFGVLTKGGAGL